MCKKLTFLIAFVLLLFIIDETFCATKGKDDKGKSKSPAAPKKRIPLKDPPTALSPLPTRRRNPDKVHSQNGVSSMLNYDPFDNPGTRNVTLNDPNEPIKLYQIGYKNRVEYVRAVITPQTVQGKGSATNDVTRKYARTMGKPTDDAGHIIGNNLGGTGKQVYNIFPQSPNINRGAWSQEEKDIRNLVLTKKKPIEVIIQLYYPNTKATRPNRFTYRAKYNGATHAASIVNP